MKYSYDRAPIRKIPLSGFLSVVSVRNKRIAAAPDSPPVSEYNANRLAKSLHPEAQYAKKWEKIFYTSSAHFVPFPLHFTCFPSLLKATVSTCSAPLCG